MCLAVPGRILEIQERDGSRIGKVQFGGIMREAYLDFVPEATVGDYVIVHVGFAISRLDAEEAERTYRLLETMDSLAAEEDPNNLPPEDNDLSPTTGAAAPGREEEP